MTIQDKGQRKPTTRSYVGAKLAAMALLPAPMLPAPMLLVLPMLLLPMLLGACAPASVGTSGSTSSSIQDSGDVVGFSVGGDTSPFIVRGPEGGPFPEGSRTYTVINNSPTRTILWRVDASVPWLIFSQDGGLLGPGASTRVTATMDSTVAEQLPVDEYPADIVFQDAGSSDKNFTIYLPFLLQVYENSAGSGLWVTPEETQEITGQVGGDLDQEVVSYSLSNTGSEALQWELSVDQTWLTLPDKWRGSLNPGATEQVEITVDPSVTTYLGEGTYPALAEFSAVSGSHEETLERSIELTLNGSESNGGRVEEGILVLYDFEDPGTVVRDRSGVEPKHDLLIEDPENVQWQPGVLRVNKATRLMTGGPATKIIDACKASREITLEAWITPQNTTQDGPARIATVSDGAYSRNATLGQGLWGGQPSDTYNVRLRSTTTDEDGMPLVSTPAGVARTCLQHVVYTRNSVGIAKFYVDGVLISEGDVGGSFNNWDGSHRLALANETDAWRPWLGDFHLVAVYDRALSGDEVTQNYEAGPGDLEAGHLEVDPSAPFTLTGEVGSTFEGEEGVYTVSNPGPETVVWSTSVSEPWIQVSTSGGVLDPNGAQPCTVTIDPDLVRAFTPGLYVGTVSFTNETNSLGDTEREVRLTIQQEGGGWNGDKPGPDNTGPTDPDNLVSSGSIVITQNGAIVENKYVNGTIYVKADNVTIRNFVVNGNGAAYGIRCDYGYQGTLIEDGELRECAAAGIYGQGFTARRLEIHEMGADGLKCRGDNLVEACWIHNLGMAPGAHADGNQTRSGSNITLRGNFFDMPKNVGGPYKSNAASINQAEVSDISNLVMEGNWLNGGNYTVYFEAEPQQGNKTVNCKLINNRFGRDYKYGVLRVFGNVQNLEVYGNVWDDTGEDMDINDQY